MTGWTEKRLLAFLRDCEPFNQLSEDHPDQLLPLLELQVAQAGEAIIRQGEQGDRMFLILSGLLQVVDESPGRPPTILTVKGAGESVGEIALLTGETRTASVYVLEEAELLTLSSEALERLGRDRPGLEAEVMEVLRLRAQKSRMQHVIRMANLFRGLDETVLQDLEKELELITIPSGQAVVRQGDPSDALFLVVGGRLRVLIEGEDGRESHVANLSRGQIFGEIGLITGEERTATIVASRDTLLARLTSMGFDKLLEQHPKDMMRSFAGPIIRQIQSQLAGERDVELSVSTIAIIAADGETPLAAFASQLSGALSDLGSTMHLNSARCDAHLQSEGVSQSTAGDPRNDGLVLWLSERESQHRFIVYESDLMITEWTRRCIRQADQILILGMASASPIPGEMERELLRAEEGRNAVVRLVLLHPSNAVLPEGTRMWLEPRNVATHHHLRTGESEGLARLARLLAGRGVGLVLSGGGARGFGHVGVVRAFLEHSVPMDMITGVSAGAIMGGLFAMGLHADAVLRKTHEANDRIDYTLPFHSMTSGANWSRALRKLFGEVQIEDLWIDFFCLSADLTIAELKIHDSGSLFHATRASTSIPGYLPPVYDGGHVLVDGGLFNNLPVDLMKEQPDVGTVIAIDVGASRTMQFEHPFDYQISGWQTFWNRINPLSSPAELPSITDILMQSISITNLQAAKEALSQADLYLAPPVQDYGLTDFDKMDEIAETGYEYAQGLVDDWRRDGTLARLRQEDGDNGDVS